MGKRRVVYRVVVGKYKGKTQLARPRLRWEDNIKIQFWEMGCGGMGWIDLVNAAMNFRVP
jgi:hypothetical protein